MTPAPSAGELVPVTDARSEALRIVAATGRLRDPAVPPWMAEGLVRLGERIRTGQPGGRVLVEPTGRAIGLSVWEPNPLVGRRAAVLLDEGFRNGATLGGFVEALRAVPEEGPLLSVDDPIPGLPRAVVAATLGPRGLSLVERVDCRYPADRPLPEAPPDPPGLRGLRADEEATLARHLGESYADFPLDLALFRKLPDPSEDLAYAARYLLRGELGPFWPEASFAVEDPRRPDRFLAAVVVNEHRGPLITELGVAPDARGRGLGRVLLRHAVAAVRARTAVPVRLVVTLENRRAHALYRSAGFVEDLRDIGGYWIDPKALGLDRLSSPFDGRRSGAHQT